MPQSLATAVRTDALQKRSDELLEIDVFYPYGYRGREMFAVRAPCAMSEKAEGLISRTFRVDGASYSILGVFRQISGPIAAGEPVGVEVRRVAFAQ